MKNGLMLLLLAAMLFASLRRHERQLPFPQP